MIIKLLTEHHLEFLSLKEGCRGWSQSTLAKMPLLEITCHGSYYMGLNARKPVFWVSDQIRPKPACSATRTSQNIDIFHGASLNIVLSRKGIIKARIRLRGAGLRLCCLHIKAQDKSV